MRQTIRRLLPGVMLIVTCVAGVTLAAILSWREVRPTGRNPEPAPRAQEQQPPAAASATPRPVQEATPEPAREQDCQTCARLDEYCVLCGYFDAIEITSHEEVDEIAHRSFKNLSAHPIYVDLDLSEGIGNEVLVRLRGVDPRHEFKIEQQYETSLAVSNEGPHLDLTDWKHYRSEWREIKNLGDGQFLTLKLSEAESNRFPKVTLREVYREVLKRGGEGWARLVGESKTINEGALYVGVSKFSLRVKVKEDGEWVVLKLLEFSLPMGC